jgi:hypothetical protein
VNPKLWDGPNPVGEAKSRHLETLDTPYLTASGPGFESRKKGCFSEVIGGNPPEVQPVELDGWFSTSDITSPPVQLVASSGYKRDFKKKGGFGNLSGGFSQGTNIIANGRGRAYSDIFKGVNDGYLDYDKISTRNGGKTYKVEYPYYAADFGVALVNGVSSVIGGGVFTEYYGFPIHTHISNEPYEDSSAVWRAKPSMVEFIYTKGEGWGSALRSPPAVSNVDHGLPAITMISPVTVVAAYAVFTPVSIPKLYFSHDLGLTWASVEMASAFPDIDLAYMSPLTEAQIALSDPLLTAQAVRARYLTQIGVVEVTPISGAPFINLFPVSSTEVLLVSPPYRTTSGTYKISVAVVSLGGQVSLRSYDVPTKHARVSAADVLGKHAWLIAIEDEDAAELFCEATFDKGASYGPISIPLPDRGRFTVVKPFTDVNSKFKAVCTSRSESGEVTMYSTEDMIEFKPEGNVATGAGIYDYTYVAWIGTRDQPAPAYPALPWTRETDYQTPDWWIE